MSHQNKSAGSQIISKDFISDFMSLTENINSPEIFRKWGAISMVAAAIERKVWVRTKGSNLYPNLYVVMCAPPGIGKTEITSKVRNHLEAMDDHFIGGNSLSKASLIDELNDANRRVIEPGNALGVHTFNSLAVVSNELGVLIPAYENDFMNALTDIYDGKGYSERRRTKDIRINIKNPNLNLLAACTPGYLRDTIPPGAWDQGFLSRVIIVYSGEQEKRSLFSEVAKDEKASNELAQRLEDISKILGQYAFTEEAMHFIDKWYLSGCDPRPDHPKLSHYNTRRVAHLLKLSMVAATARYPNGPDSLIQRTDIETALTWLLEAEVYMPDIFKSMASSGDGQTMEEAFHFLFDAYIRGGKQPVTQQRLVMFLQSRTAAHNIIRIIEIMEKAGMIKTRHVVKKGTCYEPLKQEY